MAGEPSLGKTFFDSLLGTGDALWAAIMRCNAHPCAQAAADPLPVSARASLEGWLAQAPNSGRGELSQGECVFFWDFGEDSRKLALLDDAHLARLAAVAGVTLHAPALARLVTRRERVACRDALGADLFDYALTRGQYQTGAAGDLVARRDTDMPLHERCRVHGWLALRYCSLRWPDVLRQSFQSRLDALCGEAGGTVVEVAGGLSETRWQALWRMLKKCLLREVAPSWKPYFNA